MIRKRLRGGGWRALNEDMEEVLFDWIMDLRTWNLRVSQRMIRQQAKSLTEGSLPIHSPGPTSFPFKASNGWLHWFMKRKGLLLWRKTTVCRATPDDCIPILVSYIIHLRGLQRTHKYTRECTYAMDKTACWFDMLSDTTVASSPGSFA